MTVCLSHRGPDHAATKELGRAVIGNTRLAILDLSPLGNQPMSTRDGRYWITYNGEVYNYKEIRSELELLGKTFITGSDTEVIIQAWATWGVMALARFNGMFAFALYDTANEELILARDRFGIKPLYYCRGESDLSFASEIKALLSVGATDRVLNDQAIYDFLVHDVSSIDTSTFFVGILSVEPGTALRLTRKSQSIERWWTLPPSGNYSGSFVEAASRLRSLLEDSVRLRLRSDVPVGSSLSGGVDSSAIVAQARRVLGNGPEFHTFTATFPGSSVDEGAQAKLVAGNQGCIIHMVTPTLAELIADLDQLVWTIEEPFASPSVFLQYRVMALAHKNGLKVLLDGQGADELFAGYPYLISYRIAELVRGRRLLEALREAVGALSSQKSVYSLLAAIFILLPHDSQFRLIGRPRWLDRRFANRWGSLSTYLSKVVLTDGLNEQIRRHVDNKIRHLLLWDDKNSMAHSVETRLPFLDYRLVEFAVSLPADFRIRAGRTKAVLREAVRGDVPEAIRTGARKIGFAAPEDEWLIAPDFISLARRSLGSGVLARLEVVDEKEARRILRKAERGDAKAGKVLWRMVVLERWLKVWFGSANPESPIGG